MAGFSKQDQWTGPAAPIHTAAAKPDPAAHDIDGAGMTTNEFDAFAGTGAGRRALVAEDDALNRRLAAVLLEAAGWRVDEACDGAEAVSLAARQRYDVLLVDVHMPRMGGIEAVAAIRGGVGPSRAALVAACTSDCGAESRRALAGAGCDFIIQKPYTPADLLDAVRRQRSA